MSKRKHGDITYDDMQEKLNEIEKELEQNKALKRSRRVISSSSSTSQDSSRDRWRSTLKDPSQLKSAPPAYSDEQMAVEMMIDPEDPRATTQSTDSENVMDTPTTLDPELMETLGIEPRHIYKFGKELQSDLAARLERICTSGLSKKIRMVLLQKYLIPANCKLSQAPSLNQEVKATLRDSVIKRDRAIETKQKVTAAAISSLGEAITSLLSSKNNSTKLVHLLMDTARLISDCQYNDSLNRRKFVLTSTKKKMLEPLHSTKIDNYLFGSNLSDLLMREKKKKASGKAKSSSVKGNKNTTASSSKDATTWKTTDPGPSSGGSSSGKGKATVASQTKNQHASSSKPSRN